MDRIDRFIGTTTSENQTGNQPFALMDSSQLQQNSTEFANIIADELLVTIINKVVLISTT
jgi:dihydroorotate dehydrogenase